MSEATPEGPLGDVVVLDLTRALAGPQAAMMLGDLGARVIKVESATGDDTRAWGPPWAGADTGHHEDSTYFMSANRNKESIVLDLKDRDDAEVLAALVRRSDVLLGTSGSAYSPPRVRRRATPRAQPAPGDRSITGFGHDGARPGAPATTRSRRARAV